MWINDYELLSSADQERFRKNVNYLLNKTFILSEIYEARDRIGKINGEYRFVERNYSLFEEYLKYAGYNLVKDDAKGIISISSPYNHNNAKLDKYTTLFLLTLRSLYDEELERNANKNVVFVNAADVIYRMMEDKLILKKPTVQATVDTLRILIKFNVISRLEYTLDDPRCSIVIYPSITKVISNEKITAIYDIMFKEENNEEQEGYDFSKIDNEGGAY